MEVLRRKRKQTVVLDEVGLIVNPLEDFMFYGGGKGGGGGVQYIPMQQEPTTYTPPPAPAPTWVADWHRATVHRVEFWPPALFGPIRPAHARVRLPEWPPNFHAGAESAAQPALKC